MLKPHDAALTRNACPQSGNGQRERQNQQRQYICEDSYWKIKAKSICYLVYQIQEPKQEDFWAYQQWNKDHSGIHPGFHWHHSIPTRTFSLDLNQNRTANLKFFRIWVKTKVLQLRRLLIKPLESRSCELKMSCDHYYTIYSLFQPEIRKSQLFYNSNYALKMTYVWTDVTNFLCRFLQKLLWCIV